MTPENRTKHLARALGYQGGTIHQLCAEIGCDVHDFLYSTLPERMSEEFVGGWFGVRTCEAEYKKNYLFPKNKGNLQFWFGVISGQRLIDLDNEHRAL